MPVFCCLGHYKNHGNVFNEHSSCSKHFSSSALILFPNCFLEALQHMVLRKKKVVRLVLTHLFSADKQKCIEIILSKMHVEYTFLKTWTQAWRRAVASQALTDSFKGIRKEQGCVWWCSEESLCHILLTVSAFKPVLWVQRVADNPQLQAALKLHEWVSEERRTLLYFGS